MFIDIIFLFAASLGLGTPTLGALDTFGIVFVAACGVLSGANSFAAIHEYALLHLHEGCRDSGRRPTLEFDTFLAGPEFRAVARGELEEAGDR
jgi:hypothetical protein